MFSANNNARRTPSNQAKPSKVVLIPANHNHTAPARLQSTTPKQGVQKPSPAPLMQNHCPPANPSNRSSTCNQHQPICGASKPAIFQFSSQPATRTSTRISFQTATRRQTYSSTNYSTRNFLLFNFRQVLLFRHFNVV